MKARYKKKKLKMAKTPSKITETKIKAENIKKI